MRPTSFIISSIFGFFLLAGAYALLIDKVVIPERTVPYAFSQYLLEASTGITGKVIVDAGSSAHHGIETTVLSEYFQAPVIVVADSASYPLRNKILKLLRYARKGDTVLLPLEWGYYTKTEDLPESFLSMISDKNLSLEYYFNDLPVIEKLRFIFTKYPLRTALQSLPLRNSAYIAVSEPGRLRSFNDRLQAGDNESFGGSNRDGPEEMIKPLRGIACQDYATPGRTANSKFEISDVFRSDLKLLKTLSDSGVNIYFTWPSVVDGPDSACNQDAKFQRQLNRFTRQLAELVRSSGFQFIGAHEDSHFTAECFLDTYYHLRHSCAVTRTENLVNAFKEVGITAIHSPHTPQYLNQSLLLYIQELREKL